MRREGSDPPKGHAASGIVAFVHLVVVVPLRLSPCCEWKRVRLTLVACSARIRGGPSHILGVRPFPHSAEVRLSIRKTRGGGLQIRFGFQRLAFRDANQSRDDNDRKQKLFHDRSPFCISWIELCGV